MPKVLFVCTANRFRSPLAAAIFKRFLLESQETGRWRVSSAGTWTRSGLPVVEHLEEVAREFKLELGTHSSYQVNERLLKEADLILTMEPGQKEALLFEFPHHSERIYLLSEVVERRQYGIPDTYGSPAEVREVAQSLQDLLFAGYRNIKVLAIALHNQRT